MKSPAVGAFVMNRLPPLMTHPSPSGSDTVVAVVRRPAGLEPAPGSVNANDATVSPLAMPGSHRARCSSVPYPTRT